MRASQAGKRNSAVKKENEVSRSAGARSVEGLRTGLFRTAPVPRPRPEHIRGGAHCRASQQRRLPGRLTLAGRGDAPAGLSPDL